jgi:hypothetical protein
MTTLYELTTEYRTALAVLDGSEFDEQTIRDTLDGMQFPIEEKVRNVAMFVHNLEATTTAIKVAEGHMADRRKVIENKVAAIKEYLKSNMEACEITKIESPYLTLSIKKNPPSVQIDRDDLIPPKYMKQPEPPPPSPDKKAIGEALKLGEIVPGCSLKAGTRLEIK